jgi:hypothetical protein
MRNPVIVSSMYSLPAASFFKVAVIPDGAVGERVWSAESGGDSGVTVNRAIGSGEFLLESGSGTFVADTN